MALNNPALSLGVGQTWADFLGSRAQATTYTNNTGRTILVQIYGTMNAAVTATVLLDGSFDSYHQNNGTGAMSKTIDLVIRPGGTYQISGMSTLNRWYELR